MVSKTIWYNGVHYFQTHPFLFLGWNQKPPSLSLGKFMVSGVRVSKKKPLISAKKVDLYGFVWTTKKKGISTIEMVDCIENFIGNLKSLWRQRDMNLALKLVGLIPDINWLATRNLQMVGWCRNQKKFILAKAKISCKVLFDRCWIYIYIRIVI